MNNTARLNILKHTIYVVLMMMLYVLQTVPGLFVIGGVKPILLVPAAISIAMMEGEFVGGIYGALAGLLCDTGGFLLFGFNGFVLTLCCVASGLLVIYLMRCNLLACLLFAFITLFIRGSIEYLFAYGMWNYENAWLIYRNRTLPVVAYSTVAVVPLFYLFRALSRRFASFEEDKL